MTIDDFKKSLSESKVPAGLDPHLEALWYAGKGEWERAHEIVQDMGSRESAWIHAHLHRQEGDRSNAQYWYRSAGKSMPRDANLETEWSEIAAALLNCS